jgi:hypothetical protein
MNKKWEWQEQYAEFQTYSLRQRQSYDSPNSRSEEYHILRTRWNWLTADKYAHPYLIMCQSFQSGERNWSTPWIHKYRDVAMQSGHIDEWSSLNNSELALKNECSQICHAFDQWKKTMVIEVDNCASKYDMMSSWQSAIESSLAPLYSKERAYDRETRQLLLSNKSESEKQNELAIRSARFKQYQENFYDQHNARFPADHPGNDHTKLNDIFRICANKVLEGLKYEQQAHMILHKYFVLCEKMKQFQVRMKKVGKKLAKINEKIKKDEEAERRKQIDLLQMEVLQMNKLTLQSEIMKDKSLNNESGCVICFGTEKHIVFVPCGHLACCSECSQTLDECPICRQRIIQKIKVFHV